MPEGTTGTTGATPHRIGWAVNQMKAGVGVTRQGCKTPGQTVSYCAGGRVNTKGYIRLKTASGQTWPMTFGQRDILAKDWQLAS